MIVGVTTITTSIALLLPSELVVYDVEVDWAEAEATRPGINEVIALGFGVSTTITPTALLLPLESVM